MRETELLLEGVSPDSITVGFLVGVMDVAEDHRFQLDGVSVLRVGRGETGRIDRGP